MIITPVFADKQNFVGNALYEYLLKFDRLHMGDGALLSNVDYAGDSFSVAQYEKNQKNGLKESCQKI
jgi:hypothetical protein